MKSPRAVATLMVLGLIAGSGWLPSGLAGAEYVRLAQPSEEPGIALRSQGDQGVAIHFGLGTFGMSPADIAGGRLQTITLDGVLLPNDAGAPDLPGLGRYVALPQGARAELTVVSVRTEVFKDVAVAPAPVIPRGDDDSPLVYLRDPAIYGRDAFYPETPVRLSEPMVLRGVDAVIVGITPFQYNPVTYELVVYTEIELRIDFVGGSGIFGEDRLRSRFWEPILRGHLLNHQSLTPLDPAAPAEGGRYGYEYVIISPTDAGFVSWAQQLRDWRKLQGISTEVFTTAETGTTASQIESWLNNAYSSWAVPPAAFLILGDYPSSGDGSRDIAITAPIWNSYCVSDNIYADVDGDNLPDMAHGRICARTAAELGHMVTKMLDYEQEPYTDAAFYDHPVIAGGWQTERWFILCTEVCYGHQANVLGKHPVREYAIYSGTPGSVWSTATNTSTVVTYFGPNGLGYIPSTPGHLTDWGGNATRINNDLNAGAYMLLHRDHGYELGWGEPSYNTSSLNGLSNTMYPFVFSINCLTGKYNYPGETFTEKFHRMTDGAVGLVAASEVSYSFVNDTFVWGMFDGMWEGFMPDYGPYPHGPDPLRTCFGMCYGKYFLQASNWPYNTSSKTVTYHLFHHHGDAYLRMNTEVPQHLTVVHAGVLQLGADHYTVQANAGAQIALTVNGEIIGVAEATGSAQDVPITPQAQAGTMILTVTGPNYYRYVEEVPIQGGTPPPVAAFTGEPTSGCVPLTVAFTDQSAGEITSWSWTFGDGGVSSAQNPSHQYTVEETYTVSLTVTGPAGSGTETKTDYIAVAGPPTAEFAGSPTSGVTPLTVSFTDLSTGGPTSWSWDFGDGGTSAAQNPSHQYPEAGDYTVTLTASNACGADTETKTGYIHVTAPPPVALALSDLPVAGTVTGTYSRTHLSDNVREVITEVSSETHPRKWYSLLEHRWDFGVPPGTSVTFHLEAYRPDNSDGDDFAFEYSTDGANFTHLVTVASAIEQNYSAALPPTVSGTVYIRVVDTNRVQSRQSLDAIYVDYMDIESTTNPVAPVADFTATPTSGYAPLIVQFTDLSSGNPSSWSWSFGDGGTSSAQNPSHQYDDPSSYTVTLTATNAYGSHAETKVDYITVVEHGTQEMHVHDMVVTRRQTGTNQSGVLQVWISDQAGQPVSGATVYVDYTGPTVGSGSGVTGADGSVSIASSKTRTPVGEWCFEVTNVTHATHAYNAAANLVTVACESGWVRDGEGASALRLDFGLGGDRVLAAGGSRTLHFHLSAPAHVELAVFNVAGQKIGTLVDGWHAAGPRAVQIDDIQLASGVYFLRLTAGGLRETRRVMLVR